jgi:lysozyme family protein
MNEQQVIDEILRREGWPKYTNIAADRGGPTKGGITLLAWAGYKKRPPAIGPNGKLYAGAAVTAAEIAAISESEARAFYRHEFIVAPNFHLVADEHLRELLIDAGVNHGPRHPSKWVQWAAEVKQDGVLGPISIAAINACAPLELFLWVMSFRIRLYGRLVSTDPELKRARAAGINLQAIFAEGWNNRAAEFLEAAARRIEIDHQGNKR